MLRDGVKTDKITLLKALPLDFARGKSGNQPQAVGRNPDETSEKFFRVNRTRRQDRVRIQQLSSIP